jgi:hypothetical protein
MYWNCHYHESHVLQIAPIVDPIFKIGRGMAMDRRQSEVSRIGQMVKRACAAAAIGGLGLGVAFADTVSPVGNGGSLVLSQGFASTGPGQSVATVTGTGSITDGVTTVAGSDLTGNGPLTSTYMIGQTYTNSQGAYTIGTLSTGDSVGFVESYLIDVPSAIAGAYLFSLNLSSTNGLDDLSARIYSYGPNVNTTLGTLAAPANGTLVSSWSNAVNGSVSSTTINPTNLTAGLYVLEVVGQLSTGATSGSLSGQFSVEPVPLPAALPLLLSGLAGLGRFTRRRSATAEA